MNAKVARKRKHLLPLSGACTGVCSDGVSSSGRYYLYSIDGRAVYCWGLPLERVGRVLMFPGVKYRLTVEVIGVDRRRLPRVNPFRGFHANMREERAYVRQCKALAKKIARVLKERSETARLNGVARTIIFTKERDGTVAAEVPSLPGCVSWGGNLREARRHILEAIDLYLEVLSDEDKEAQR